MDTDDIQQLENQLAKAVSYGERSLIRTKLRALKREKSSGLGTTSAPIQIQVENESTQRPKSAILPNGYDSSASLPVENGHNRKPATETIPQSRVTTSKSSHFSKDTNSYTSPNDKHDGSYASKRHSYQPTFAAKEKVLVSRTPPVKRKEPTEIEEKRGRSRTVDYSFGNDTGPEAISIQTLTKQQIQFCLTEYVNRELKPNRKILPTGESLYLVCADPRILCRLVNVSKKNTIDMRCLTEISDTASDTQIKIAVEENMTLAVESARSIGCHITEEDVLKIIHHDKDIIHKVLLKILSARVVDFEGMEDVSSSNFTQPSFLFDKLNIHIPSSSNELDVTQSVPTKLQSSNDKIATGFTKSDKNTLTSSQEDLSHKTSGPAVAIRRICSDLPPDVRKRPQVTKAKQSSDVRGLASSFEKPRPAEPVTRQSSDSPKKLEPIQSEARSSPNNIRSYKDTGLSKSSNKSVPLVEEQKKPPAENKTLQASSEVQQSPRSLNKYSPRVVTDSQRSPQRAKTSESQNNNLDTASAPKQNKFTQPTPSAVPDNKTPEPTPILEPVPAPKQTPPAPKEPTPSPPKEPTPSPPKEPTPSPPPKEPTPSPPKEPTPSPHPKEPTPSPPKEPTPSPPKVLTPKLSLEIPSISSESPNDSPANSTNSTPIASIDSTKESDEYLLTLHETDPSLTYEQRKRIRQLKRMLKQNQTKK